MNKKIKEFYKDNLLKNIKAKYILKEIFKYLRYDKSLEIITYNKEIQNRLDISINNYKDYLSTEIEIIPKENKYGKFLNNNYSDKPYYHIYINDNEKEIKKDYFDINDKVTKIKLIIDYEVKSFYSLFYDCKYIKKINFMKFKYI